MDPLLVPYYGFSPFCFPYYESCLLFHYCSYFGFHDLLVILYFVPVRLVAEILTLVCGIKAILTLRSGIRAIQIMALLERWL